MKSKVAAGWPGSSARKLAMNDPWWRKKHPGGRSKSVRPATEKCVVSAPEAPPFTAPSAITWPNDTNAPRTSGEVHARSPAIQRS